MVKLRGRQAARQPSVVPSSQLIILHVNAELYPYNGHDEDADIRARSMEPHLSRTELLPRSPPNPVSPQTTPFTRAILACALQRMRLQPYVAAVPEKGVGVTSINARRTSENVAWKNWSSDLLATAAVRIGADVERLEDKAVSVASMNTSIAEVNSVYEEIQAWLGSEDNKKQEGEHVSLLMSAALLRSILNDRASDSQTAEPEGESWKQTPDISDQQLERCRLENQSSAQ
ncbi:hypothetical protein BD410DRAFT_809938 [Rickenella mellea]|uniref:Uncharacterized protein n=1 Tax=Rickenella mellea TaxID=50990 RepID=A0A4Y7PG57_9AGAM|nr:hypothetical protein BD410DRAFT_809938 [Rickenella mellea]